MQTCIAFLFLNYKSLVSPLPFLKALLYHKGIFIVK